MSLQSIPMEWRRDVCRALRSGQSHFTSLGRQKWERGYPGVFKAELVDDLVTFLSQQNPQGCSVIMDYPPGKTWEFWFIHLGHRSYGKLLLEHGTDRVLILSAHHPIQKKLRCED